MTDYSGKPVVVGVDGSASSLAAVRLAAREASLRASPLRVVHCFVWPTYQVPNYGDLRRDAQRLLAQATATASTLAPDIPVSGHVVDGEAGAVLRAESREAALTVLGSSDPAHRPAAADSVVVYVAAHTTCPVMVAHPARQPHGPILVGVDGSADSAAAMRFALFEAAGRQTDVVAVFVERDDDGEDGPLPDALALAQQAAGPVKVQQRWVGGRPGEALVNESATGQLIVVGARGHLRMLLGTVSFTLLRNAYCPVAVVRG